MKNLNLVIASAPIADSWIKKTFKKRSRNKLPETNKFKAKMKSTKFLYILPN